ncbi:hypothetical protein Hanom_Chr02g00146781 [Helianthus anomalus]
MLDFYDMNYDVVIGPYFCLLKVVDVERNWSMTIVEEKLNSIYVSMLLFFMVLHYLNVIPTLTGANQYQSV